jgi:hypothetical protein
MNVCIKLLLKQKLTDMKKLLISIGCLISLLSSSQDIVIPYDFPVKPGTEKWARLNSSQEMDDVCTIPINTLRSLSTDALFVTCLNYPRIIDFFLFEDLQTGFNICSKRFNGLNELLTRPDLKQSLLNEYLSLDIKNKTLKKDTKLTHSQIAFIELLIAQEKVIEQFNHEEKNIILSRFILNLETRKEINESFYRQRTTAFCISRILNSQNILPSENRNGIDIFQIFNNSGVILDTSIIDKLLSISKSR